MLLLKRCLERVSREQCRALGERSERKGCNLCSKWFKRVDWLNFKAAVHSWKEGQDRSLIAIWEHVEKQ